MGTALAPAACSVAGAGGETDGITIFGRLLVDTGRTVSDISTPLSRLLLQFIIIIGATRTLGTIFSRIGQPAVIGEIAAGILLGPSLFGWVCPNVFRFVFSTDSLVGLRLFSQVGVCLFMFEAGSLPAIECAVKSCPN